MHLLFVDESGTAPTPAHAQANPVFVIGGVIVPEPVWPRLKTGMDDIARDYRVDGEIKWRFFSASDLAFSFLPAA